MQASRNATANGKAEGNSTDRKERADRKEVQRAETKDQRIIITVGNMKRLPNMSFRIQ